MTHLKIVWTECCESDFNIAPIGLSVILYSFVYITTDI